MPDQVVEDRGYPLRSTKLLVLVAIVAISLVTVIWGTLSGPMAEWGIKDFTVRVLGMRLDPAEREGRIVILYHTIAMAVVAIEVYFITAMVPMQKTLRTMINSTITVGYLTAMIFGLWFAYFGHNYTWHGLFLFGQSLVFFAGVLLAVALWPWSKEYRCTDPDRAHRGKVDLERAAFFTMTVTTLISALFGAVPGSNMGNGFETFLAEDVVREVHKSPLQLSVIGHLHIMLALMGVAITLIIGRWLDFRGRLHKIAMPLMISGSAVLSIGVWLVVPYEDIAHYIIYGGATLAMLGALMLVIYGWRKLIRDRLAELDQPKAGFGQKLRALVHDPLKFGTLWQMVFMNFTVSGVGIYMAVELDDVIRKWPWREERITLTGHWHILSAIIATIILLYYADMVGLRGRTRQWFGWLVIVGSDLAFASVTVFSLKRLFIGESEQQPLVDTTMLLTDIGLATVLVVLGAFLGWQLVLLMRRKGWWARPQSEDDQLPQARRAEEPPAEERRAEDRPAEVEAAPAAHAVGSGVEVSR